MARNIGTRLKHGELFDIAILQFVEIKGITLGARTRDNDYSLFLSLNSIPSSD